MKTIIYLRTSTEEQNPGNQLRDCLSINKYGDYKVIEEKHSAFRDKDRKEFNRAIKLIKQSGNSHFIVWDLDRIYRNRKKLIEFFDMCKIYNCKIHSFRQTWLNQFDNIPEPFNEIMFDIMLQVMGWIAEEESKKKSDRVKLAVRKSLGKKTKSFKGNLWGRKPLSNKVRAEVLNLHKQGLAIRNISKQVFYWDKNNNKKQISIGGVHKIIKQFNKTEDSLNHDQQSNNKITNGISKRISKRILSKEQRKNERIL